MSENLSQNIEQNETDSDAVKLVPVTESIKYRKRAQQAESKILEYEQQLNNLKQEMQDTKQQLDKTNLQRDEMLCELIETDNRRSIENSLAQAGAVDIETAMMILSGRINFKDKIQEKELASEIEKLFADKPFLAKQAESAAVNWSMPSVTSSAKQTENQSSAQLGDLAKRAATSGSRKDIGQYLRLRRQLANRI